MKRRKLKFAVKVFIIGAFAFSALFSISMLVGEKVQTVSSNNSEFTYVNDYIFDTYSPVISQEEKIVKPYLSEVVSVYKSFYEKDATEEKQQNSIILHEGIYMQNSGVDYKADESFDIIAVLSGTVVNVFEDTLLGNTIEVRHSTDLITTYQSLGEVSVKKGDTVTQGQIIGKSGTCALNANITNGLHFELYKNGQVLNPETYYEKTLNQISGN